MQQLGLIALILLIPIALIIPKRWPLKRGLSVSENIASNKTSQLLFSVAFTPITILYYSFLAFWLGAHYGVPIAYYYVLFVAFIAQLVLTWVPARGVKALKTHTGASYIVAIAMLAVVGFVLFSSKVELPLYSIIACWLFLAMGAVMTFIYLCIPPARKNYLIYELVYFASFWVVILLLTYF